MTDILTNAATATADPQAEARVRGDDRAHVFHSWSAQALIDPLPVAGGAGSTFWDYQGTHYLDFSSQLVNLNLGHQHPDLVAAIQHQAGRLATIQPSMANDVRSELARHCRQRFLVLDHSKFGRGATVRGGHIAEANVVFTDRPVPAAIADQLRDAGVRLVSWSDDIASTATPSQTRRRG